MLAFAPMPFVDRGAGAVHLAPLLLLAAIFGDALHLLVDDAHLQFEGVPAGETLEIGGIAFVVPGLDHLTSLPANVVPAEIGRRLEAQCGDPLALYALLLTEVDADLCAWYARTLDVLVARGLRAVLTWCNIPSLELAASRLGLPVVHLELGPLRAPNFVPSMYLDFVGVNGRNGASGAVNQYLLGACEIDFDESRWAWAVDAERLRHLALAQPEYAHGVALQVEDDSNTIAFGAGLSGTSLAYRAWQAAGRSRRILVRNHPGAHFGIRGFPFVDTDSSPDSVAFVSRCSTIHSVNSSVGFEAALLDRTPVVHGDSALHVLNGADSRRADSLAGLFFGYLVPAALVLSPQYLAWRLGNPGIDEVARTHLDFLSRRPLGRVSPQVAGDAPMSPASPGGHDVSFNSRETGLDWLRSGSVQRQLALAQNHAVWLEDQRGRWQRRCEELQEALDRMQATNTWLEEQRLAWARSADEHVEALMRSAAEREAQAGEIVQLVAELAAATRRLDALEQNTGVAGEPVGTPYELRQRGSD